MSLATTAEMLMPKLSDSMEQGTILSWLIETGTAVSAGQDLLEVETDKANMTVQAEASGLLEILVEEGSTLAVGALIARLHHEGGQPPPPPSGGNGSARATPLARRIAAMHKIALTSLSGSGLGGRITKADVRAAAGLPAEPAVAAVIASAAPSIVSAAPPIASAAPPIASAAPPSTAPGLDAPGPATAPAPAMPAGIEGAKGEVDIQELTRLQAVVARRMAEAKATVPHFQVQTEVRMDAAVDLRAKLQQLGGQQPVPSFNDLIVRAAALALREHPKANGSYHDGHFELHGRINVGIAVAAEDALVVPTIFDADRKSLGEISRESRRLAEQARSGAVTPPELSGGTFTVSNLGMFGMTAINPVINLPQAAILGVGMTRQLLLRGGDGEIEDASIITLTLSCDHRILYGAEAALFLGTIRDLLESPLRAAL